MLKTTRETAVSDSYRSGSHADPTKTDSPQNVTGRATDRPDFEALADQALKGVATHAERVRPDELVRALEAIEKRRNTIVTGTLPLKDALKELQTDITPEEILREVQEQRTAKTTVRKKDKGGGKRYLQAGIGLVAVVATALAVRSFLGQSEDYNRQFAIAPPPNQATSVGGVKSQPQQYALSFSSMFFQSPTMKKYSAIKDGDVFPMDISRVGETQRMLNGDGTHPAFPKNLYDRLYLETQPGQNDFPVVRYGDKWYIRGYTLDKGNPIAPNPSDPNRSQIYLYQHPQQHTTVTRVIPPSTPPPNATPREIAKNYSQPTNVTGEGGPATKQIQLAVDAMTGSMTGTGDGNGMRYQIGVDPDKLDKRTWERWSDPNFKVDPRGPILPGRAYYLLSQP